MPAAGRDVTPPNRRARERRASAERQQPRRARQRRAPRVSLTARAVPDCYTLARRQSARRTSKLEQIGPLGRTCSSFRAKHTAHAPARQRQRAPAPSAPRDSAERRASASARAPRASARERRAVHRQRMPSLTVTPRQGRARDAPGMRQSAAPGTGRAERQGDRERAPGNATAPRVRHGPRGAVGVSDYGR